MKCADRLTHTYLKDIHGKFHLITAQGNVSEIHIHEDQDKEMQYWKTKRIQGYDKRLLKKTQEKLEPYVMLNVFSYVHDMVQEVKTLQEEQGDGNVLLGIGRALGAALEGASVGTSSIIIAIGVCIKDSWNGIGDLDKKTVGSLSDAAGNLIQSWGEAFKNSTIGLGNFFNVFLGGIGGSIKWFLLLALIFGLLIMNWKYFFNKCFPQNNQQLYIQDMPPQESLPQQAPTVNKLDTELPLIASQFSLIIAQITYVLLALFSRWP